MVLRLQLLGLLKRCCHCPPSTNLKCAYSGLTTSSFSSTPSSAPTTSRALSITWTLRKDVPEPQDMEARPKLDLDMCKSVVKSQALQEAVDKDEESVTAEENHVELSPLEARPQLDLDMCKSVVKSQALEEAVDKDEEPVTAEENHVELSPLEESRRLVETRRLAGKSVPVNITDEQLEILSEKTTKTARKKYLKFLTSIEAKMEKKKKEMKAAIEGVKENNGNHKGVDGEDYEGEPKVQNTFLRKFSHHTMDSVLDWRVAHAMQYGQPLVFDMSYDQQMSGKDMNNTITQLIQSEILNRRAVDPFHLHFCNLQPNGAYHHEFLKSYSQETWEHLLITTSSQQHVDMFPRENLVYLSADSLNVLHTFDHSKVYIIGAFVDHLFQPRVSLANSKRFKLASARLPLNEYLNCKSGAKNLTLDQMIQILLTVKQTGSWEKALEFVPKSKLRTENNVPPKTTAVRAAYRVSQPNRVPLFVSKKKLKNMTVELINQLLKPPLKSEQISGQVILRTGMKSKNEKRSKAMPKKNNSFDKK